MESNAEVVVIGSGAGGSAAAVELAAAGRDVLVLELGDRENPSSFTQREEQMMPRLFQDAGARTTADRAIQVIQGKGVGGSTLHNLNLCKRIDDELLVLWEKKHQIQGLAKRLQQHYDHFEHKLTISAVPMDRVNANNQLIKHGSELLGWANGPLRHNRTGCIGSGFCELGCAYDAKNNAAKILIPEAERLGARIFPRHRATRLVSRFGRIIAVRGHILDDYGRPIEPFIIHCKQVILGASATGSAALVLASGLSDPYRQVGQRLTLHPGATVGGRFSEIIDGWKGIPQSWECSEFLHPTDIDRRIWIIPVFGHPATTAAMFPGVGPAVVERLGSYRNIGAVSPMLHDLSFGRVESTDDARPVIRYQLHEDDRRMMAKGLAKSAQLLLAAGANEVLIPTAQPQVITTSAQAHQLMNLNIGPLDPHLTAVHPMGGLCMGGNPDSSAVNPEGRYHWSKNLWIADGSLFPSSTGVPPQWSIYAFGRMVGQAAAAAF